ncbi:MAG: hypothetical protein Q9157_007823 [Trypethelium eluteriae]
MSFPRLNSRPSLNSADKEFSSGLQHTTPPHSQDSEHDDVGQPTKRLEQEFEDDCQPLKLNSDRWTRPLQYLALSQENVAQLRLQVQELRTSLKMKRLKVSECDRLFMDELYHWWSNRNGKDNGKLTALYDQCQEVRREVGPAEDDYEHLELRLGEVEYANTNYIRRVTTALQKNVPDMPLQGLEESASGSHISFESSTSPGSQHDGESEDHNESVIVEGPNGIHALTSLALRQHEEDLSACETTSPRHENYPLVPRLRHGTRSLRSLSLDNPPASNELSAIWDPVPSQLGISPSSKSSSPSSDHDDDSDYKVSRESEDVLRSSHSTLDPDLSSLLIFNHERASRSTLSKYLLEFRSSHHRVNRWLLHRLRTSYIEASSLKQAVSKVGIKDARWHIQALDLWDIDEAAVTPIGTPPQEPSVESFSGTFPLALSSLQPHHADYPSEALNSSADLPIFLWMAVLPSTELLESI